MSSSSSSSSESDKPQVPDDFEAILETQQNMIDASTHTAITALRWSAEAAEWQQSSIMCEKSHKTSNK